MPEHLLLPAYLVIWWITLFFLLPVGIKPHEKPEAHIYAAAPQNPNLKKKVLWNFPLAAVATLLLHALITWLRP